MTNELVLNAKKFGIEQSKAEQIEKVFVPMVAMLKDFESAYNEVIKESEKEITNDVVAAARQMRLSISKIRIKTENARKEQKEEYLRAGKAIDGIANIVKYAVIDKEKKLNEIETYYQQIEKERLQKIQEEREAVLKKYDAEIDGIDLSAMDEKIWNNFLNGYKLEYEKKIEAEKKAEEARLKAEAEEQERLKRIEEENERLKKEAIERERLQKIEDEKRAKEKAILEKKLEKERHEREKAEKLEAEKRAKEAEERERLKRIEDEKHEKEKLEYEKKIQVEREERERIEIEIQKKKEEEMKIEAEKEAMERAKRLAPDKEKILNFAILIQKIEIPILKNKEAKLILENARKRLEVIYLELITQAEKMGAE